jgi:MFS family permease
MDAMKQPSNAGGDRPWSGAANGGQDVGAERRTFWACFAGCALDNLDAQIFSLLIPTLAAAWGMSRGEAGWIATSTLLTGAVGGLASGYLADRYGRVPVMQATILWFSLFTLLCGFAQTPTQMLILRSLQGFGFGGEFAVGATLIAEVTAPRRRGTVMGLVASGYSVGAVGAALLFSLSFALLPPSIAWRATFWAGVLPALLVVYLRQKVQEPAVRRHNDEPPAIGRLFGAGLRRSTMLGLLVVVGATAGINALFVWLPTFLQQERGLSPIGSGLNFAVTTGGSVVGYLIGAVLLDRLGRRRVFVVGSAATVLFVAIYLLAPLDRSMLIAMGFASGFAVVWTNVGMSPLLAELYPTQIRATGLGFCYSVGRGIGALAPGVVGLLAPTLSLGGAIGAFVAAGYALVCACVFALPETRGVVFTADTDAMQGRAA